MPLVVPGVQVSVIQEIVPPQLAPSGVLGLIGLTEKKLDQVVRVSSWPRFLEVCGPASAYSLPEAKDALSNGVYQLAVVSLTEADLNMDADPGRAKGQSYGFSVIQVKSKKQTQGSPRPALTYDNSKSTFAWGEKQVKVSSANASEVLTSLNGSELHTDENGLEFSASALPGSTEFVSAEHLLSSNASMTVPSRGSSIVWLQSANGSSPEFICLSNIGKEPITIILKNLERNGGQLVSATATLKDPSGAGPSPVSGTGVIDALINLAKTMEETIAIQPSIFSIGSGEGNGIQPPCSFVCLDTLVCCQAKAPGTWANNFHIKLSRGQNGSEDDKWDVEIFASEAAMHAQKSLEMFRGKVLGDINRDSKLITLSPPSLIPEPPAPLTLGPCVLLGGQDAKFERYSSCLDKLNSETDVDLVLASVPAAMQESDQLKLYDAIKSHCETASTHGHGRLGFGQLSNDQLPGAKASGGADWSSRLSSDRFVLVAPQGTAAAVAGRVGSLNYWESPTFKSLSGLTDRNPTFAYEDQEALLKAHVLPVSFRLGRGVIMVRGITTNGDQISVRRIADRAVRGVQLIGEMFIGTLNNEDGRNALRQKITEFLMQMKNEGALVPSTDGKSPPFQVDVYSSEDDFAKGIVRVQLAVRPVRAIDYIYATILVQA